MSQRDSQAGGPPRSAPSTYKPVPGAPGGAGQSGRQSRVTATASARPAAKPATEMPGGTFKARSSSAPTHEQIAVRARFIWQAKGCKPGQDEKNWLEAEAQLKREQGLR